METKSNSTCTLVVGLLKKGEESYMGNMECLIEEGRPWLMHPDSPDPHHKQEMVDWWAIQDNEKAEEEEKSGGMAIGTHGQGQKPSTIYLGDKARPANGPESL